MVYREFVNVYRKFRWGSQSQGSDETSQTESTSLRGKQSTQTKNRCPFRHGKDTCWTQILKLFQRYVQLNETNQWYIQVMFSWMKLINGTYKRPVLLDEFSGFDITCISYYS